MDIAKLKQIITDNPSHIKTIMEKIPLFYVKDFGEEYRASGKEGGNSTGVCVKKDTLKFFYSSNDGMVYGDIITMVQSFKELSFINSVKFITNSIGLTDDELKESENAIVAPFGGYYLEAKGDEGEYYKDLLTYPDSILDENNFMKFISIRFENDGISAKVQHEFGIRYDLLSERISVPWRNVLGEIVGITGRINCDNFEDFGYAKWKPVIRFPKAQVLYGLYENYDSILKDGIVIITESEKGVLQLRSMTKDVIDEETGEVIEQGFNYGVAVGSNSVSKVQTKLIQSCFPKDVIIAFDEGIEESHLQEVCRRLQYSNVFHHINIGYIFDRENKYLPKGSKLSPTDIGRVGFENLMKECLYKI